MKVGLLLLVASLVSVGCGGSGSSSSSGSNGGSGGFTPASIQGQYEAVAQSNSNPSSVAFIETDFTQTGTDVFAGKAATVVILGTRGANGVTLTGLGGECDNGLLGNDSVQGTFSTATQLSFTLTEAGSLGTGTTTGNVTFSSDGSAITSGTYNTPAACNFQADSGTITGTKIQPFSGQYAGNLNNGADAVIVSVSQSGLNLTVSGTDNGASFTMTGTVVGATFDVKGTVSGVAVEDVGIYDHTSNTFLIFSANFQFIGTLHAGTIP